MIALILGVLIYAGSILVFSFGLVVLFAVLNLVTGPGSMRENWNEVKEDWRWAK